jgi:hypothetical protein
MKKIFLPSLIIFCLAATACAQISRGSILIGGDLSASFLKQEIVAGTEYKTRSLQFSPVLGVAVKKNIFHGGYIQLGFSHVHNNTNPLESDTRSFGIGYFIRKYAVLKNNFYGFIQGNAGGSYFKSYFEYAMGTGQYKQTAIGLDISPGLSCRVSKKLHLESGLRQLAALNYQVNKNVSNNQQATDILKSNQLSFSSSLNNFTSGLYFGFRLLLDKS